MALACVCAFGGFLRYFLFAYQSRLFATGSKSADHTHVAYSQGFSSSKQEELEDLLDKADAKVKQFFTKEKAKFEAAEAAELEARKNKK